MNNEKSNETSINKKGKMSDFIIDNSVTILFIIICVIGIIASKEQPLILVSMLLERLTRNSFLVLALLIPVVAGMGLNFSITIGAMAAQVAIIVVSYLEWHTQAGLLGAFIISTPIALVLGYFIGRLLNKTRGQEMIASMITGYFADGIYQLIFLFIVGGLIPMTGDFIIPGGVGLRNTIDLMKKDPVSGDVIGIGKSLDHVWEFPFFYFVMFLCVAFIAYLIVKIKTNGRKKSVTSKSVTINKKKVIAQIIISGLLLIFSILVMWTNLLSHRYAILKTIDISFVTALVVLAFAGFNIVILKTKLGQTFKTVGQDKHIAEVSGIKVDKIRILAIMLSTLFAAWGQIIFIQNLGILNTYGSHKQIALFAVAALLIGGASVTKATVGQAFLGVLLFHTLFIVSPKAGLNLFGDAQLGEYFRTFVAYGVIGVSLGLHAWKTMVMKNKIDSE